MFLVGVGLIAIAVVTFIMAKPRDGVPKLADKPFLETVVAVKPRDQPSLSRTVRVVGLRSPTKPSHARYRTEIL